MDRCGDLAVVARRVGEHRFRDVELDDQQVVGPTERISDDLRIAPGGDDRVAGGQRSLGEIRAHAMPGARDEPDLVLSHGPQGSTAQRGVRVPVDRGTDRVSQARVGGSTLACVDAKSEIREFLTSRRAKLTPDQVGLPAYGSRRVPGLRREEVAVLAGVSVPYYTRLERGNMSGVSDNVLEVLARALRLDDAERAHLFDLARASHPATSTRRRRAAKQRPRPGVQWILDALTVPALVLNGRLDIVAGNQLGYALYAPMFDGPARPANTARFAFLDPRARDFYLDWEFAADQVVAILRSEAGRDPHDRNLQDLVGELSTQSNEFRTRWAAHNVRFHDTGVKHIHNPVVGELHLSFERMSLSADTGLTVFAFAAEPGSTSEEALNLLASWTATPDPPEATPATDRV
jgi:transcriptional regulator with XRE-family HTH domain